MSRHTPGPWTGFLSERAPGEAAWLIGPLSARPIVAAVEADEEAGLTGATVEANARLIAAAPEMYLALVGILDCIEPNDIQDHIVCKRTAREAIARAEGHS